MSGSLAAPILPGMLNPMLQQSYGAYQAMTPEQLQEAALRLRGTAQGQLAQRMLQQKRFLSAQDPAQSPQPAQGSQPQQPTAMGGFAQGGDVPDYADRYNTPLTPDQEARYQAWGQQQAAQSGRNPAADTTDYDMRGFWQSGGQFSGNGHAGDAYKKPNHPTFSTQSRYSGGDNGEGGTWSGGQNGQPYHYAPSATNLNMHSPDALRAYFRAREPGNALDLREQSRAQGGEVGNPSAPPKAYALGGFLKPQGGADFPERGIQSSGFLHTAGPGRMDNLNIHPHADSYVVPSDVVSGLGAGNSLAGAKALEMALHTGPYGTSLPTAQHHSTMPHGFHLPAPPTNDNRGFMHGFAAGGPPANDNWGFGHNGGPPLDDPDGPKRVPILAAGGEYVISPEQVRAIGHGDIKRGHEVLDKFVLHVRNRTIGQMRKLKGPVGAKS